MKTFFLLFLSCWIFSGCVYGPSVEHKTPLAVLNGDNYENAPQGADMVLAPMMKRKDRLTKIRGRVVQDIDGLEIPLKFTEVTLVSSKGQSVVQATSDIDGNFVISGVFHNGEYRLMIDSEKWLGQKDLRIENYEINDVLIHVVPKK